MNVVDLGLDVRTSGRAGKPLTMTLGRPLTDEDLAMLEVERETKPPAIGKLRETHHQIARFLAAGTKPGVVAAITGYSASRISILQNDPAFQDLVSTYRDVKDLAWADFQSLAATLTVEMVAELRDRFHEETDKFSIADINESIKLLADRTGNGPRQTNVNVNIDLAARIEAGRKRLEQLRPPDPLGSQPLTIEGTALIEPGPSPSRPGPGEPVT